jgi:hypothetical protein
LPPATTLSPENGSTMGTPFRRAIRSIDLAALLAVAGNRVILD